MKKSDKLKELHDQISKIEATLLKSSHSMSTVRRELLEEKLEDLNYEFASLLEDGVQENA